TAKLRIQRERRTELMDLCGHLVRDAGIAWCGEYGGDPLADLRHLGGAHAACSERSRAETHAGCHEGRTLLTGHRVLVARDARALERLLGKLSGELALVAKVEQHEVIIGTAAHEIEAARHEFSGECLRVVDYLACVSGERRVERFAERNCLGGDDVHERPALHAGKYLLVNGFRELR